MKHAPIAIIGRGCVLPGALTPQALGELVFKKRVVLAAAERGDWPVDPASVMCPPGRYQGDQTWSSIGGRVRGFGEVFSGEELLLDAQHLPEDEIYRWMMYAGQQALAEAGWRELDRLPVTGVVMGNLAYPTPGFTRMNLLTTLRNQPHLRSWRELQTFLEHEPPDFRQRFNYGLPVATMARALGCRAGSFALDAACASSLYAIKLACDRLQQGEVEMMLAGAVNHVENLFLHVGFASLGALSHSGRSLPFQQEADGLVPSEGAVVLALSRLDRALAEGWPVLGVIRGIGLANDGAAGSLLSPDSKGQVRALRQAYAQAGVAPSQVSLLECHATGTRVGDSAELETLGRVFGLGHPLALGSLKANLGHLISVAGGAGLLKLLAAFERRSLPPTPLVGTLLPALTDSAYEVIGEARPWLSDGPRLAAINAFGFGGNNAHLIVEQPPEPVRADSGFVNTKALAEVVAVPTLAVVALAVRHGEAVYWRDFADNLFSAKDQTPTGRIEGLAIDPRRVRIPPSDLPEITGQQLAILQTALNATDTLSLHGQRCAVYIGMSTDTEAARQNNRQELAPLLAQLGVEPNQEWLQQALDALARPVSGVRTIGLMPNVPANRINQHLDIHGPGFTIGAEENSGLVALQVAARALARDEIDCALVGAVDMSCEPVHRAAVQAMAADHGQPMADASVVLVLKRLADARRDGDALLAIIESGQQVDLDAASTLNIVVDSGKAGLYTRLGNSHAASGLLHLAAAITALHYHAVPGELHYAARPWFRAGREPRRAQVCVESIAGERIALQLMEGDGCAGWEPDQIGLFHFAAESRQALLEQMQFDRFGGDGDYRLVIVGTEAEYLSIRATVIDTLRAGQAPSDLPGLFYAQGAMTGELAFVFNGVAATYGGMGRELMLASPQLMTELERRSCLGNRFPQVLLPADKARPLAPMEQIFSSILFGQLHVSWTRDIAGIRPQAYLGISAGETNCLFAAGIWQDLDGTFEALFASDMYRGALTQPYNMVRQTWRECGALGKDEAVDYSVWRVLYPVQRLQALAEGLQPLMRIIIIHTDNDCIVSGQRTVCRDFFRRHAIQALPLENAGLTVHTPDIGYFAKQWYALHHKPLASTGDGRIYSNAIHAAYQPDSVNVADYSTRQAVNAVDFRPTVLQAYADGVRVFIEHGPRNLCSRWIDDILADQPHLCVSLDVPGKNSWRQALEVVAQLWSVQVPVDMAAVVAQVPAAPVIEKAASNVVLAAAHAPPVVMPPWQPVKTDDADLSPVIMPLAPIIPRTDQPWRGLKQKTMFGPNVDVIAEVLQQVGHVHQNYLHGVNQGVALLQQSIQSFHQGITAGVGHMASVSATPGVQVLETPILPVTPGVTVAKQPPVLPGPKWGRRELETLAAGRISSVFGSPFEQQDGYRRQVRMPMGDLLLADRVTGIDARAGELTTGTIWTETDVTWQAWYLHQGYMPPGIFIESGQADLLLISYMGIDFFNQDARVYRLLGCELSFYGHMPKPGDTLCYEIHIDGHARHGDVRLFFFHYDCYIDGQLRIKMRRGQAGFFSDQELAESEGVLWSPESMSWDRALPFDPPRVALVKSSLTDQELRRFIAGDLPGCFGEAFVLGACHTRTPTLPGGRMQLVDRVTHLDIHGGPAGRGYLRAELDLKPDHWFYQGHFKNDPCMPGTLMSDGCFQAMAIFLTALGYTLDKDGWRFEPLPGQNMELTCRGQAIPGNRQMVYEIFIKSVLDGDFPCLVADVLGSVDGRKAVYGKDLAIHLVPGWPLEGRPPEELTDSVGVSAAAVCGDIRGDSRAIAACTLGRPSEAFGHLLAPFDDNGQPVLRLPAQPYCFISRITHMPDQPGTAIAGGEVEAVLEVDPHQWYFQCSQSRVMPMAVLLETLLQPCGWLATFTLLGRLPVNGRFRNLDGEMHLVSDVLAEDGPVVTHIKLDTLSMAGDTTIYRFQFDCRQGERAICRGKTDFGIFSVESLQTQAGLPESRVMSNILQAKSDCFVELSTRPAAYFGGSAALPDTPLLMLDHITGFWPDGGSRRLGAIRTFKSVKPEEWFFKAHFFQDPVQPGSLGIEAMMQAVQFYMLHKGMHSGMRRPVFHLGGDEQPIVWRYRGQVTPVRQRIEITVDIVECNPSEHEIRVCADASLWVDGLRIYHASGLRLVLREGDYDDGQVERKTRKVELLFDPEVDTWIKDHRPMYTDPAMPMMGMVDIMADQVAKVYPGGHVVAMEDLQIQRWLLCHQVRRLRVTMMSGDGGDVAVTLEAEALPNDEDDSFWQTIANGRIRLAETWLPSPQPLPLPVDGQPQENPYASGHLFHGQAFYYLRDLIYGVNGSSGIIDIDAGSVPRGFVQPGVLDTALHLIPNDAPWLWRPDVARDKIAYPVRLNYLHWFAPLPEKGVLQGRTVVRKIDLHSLTTCVQFLCDGQVLLECEIQSRMLSTGIIGFAGVAKRTRFLRERQGVPAMGLSEFGPEGHTRLVCSGLKAYQWFPGLVQHIYGLPRDQPPDCAAVAAKDCLANHLGVHPSRIFWQGEGSIAWFEEEPAGRYLMDIEQGEDWVLSRVIGLVPQ